MPDSKDRERKKAADFQKRRGKFDEFRQFTDDEIDAIRDEHNRETCAPVEGYVPLFKQLHERFPLERRY